jgi:hypothetical protein
VELFISCWQLPSSSYRSKLFENKDDRSDLDPYRRKGSIRKGGGRQVQKDFAESQDIRKSREEEKVSQLTLSPQTYREE